MTVVEDLPGTVAFYERLGGRVSYAQPGTCAFVDLAGGVQLGLYDATAPGPPPAVWLPVLDVEDLEAAVVAVRPLAVRVGPAQDVPGGRPVVVTDPAGRQVELHQP